MMEGKEMLKTQNSRYSCELILLTYCYYYCCGNYYCKGSENKRELSLEERRVCGSHDKVE